MAKAGRSRVISIALPPSTVEQIEDSVRTRGFSGRSEVVRAGLQSLFRTFAEDTADAAVPTYASLTLHHQKAWPCSVVDVRHGFNDVVRTMMHHDTEDGRCIELLLLHGPAARLRALDAALRACPDVHSVELHWMPIAADDTSGTTPPGGQPLS